MGTAPQEHFLKQALNNAWANATLFKAVLDLPAGAVDRPLPSFFGTIARTLNHIHEVDLYYLDALEDGGRGRSVFDRDDVADMAALSRAQAGCDLRLAVFCKALTSGRLAATCRTERKEGMVEERTDHLLLHLFQHQIHHRGQVHGLVSALGADPPQLDDFYLEFGRVPSAQAYWS